MRSLLLASVFVATNYLFAAQPGAPRITHIVKDVKLYHDQAAAHAATINTPVSDGSLIRTGVDSGAEVIFADQTTLRLGANTALHLDTSRNTMNLEEGAILFQIPAGASHAKIDSSAIRVESKRGTGILERHRDYYVKCLVLEGEARTYLPRRLGESLVIHPGQVLITKPDATALPDPAHFDIARMMQTCLLVHEFRPLLSQRLIEAEEQKQAALIKKGAYVPSNLVIPGRGTLVYLLSPTPAPQPAR